MQPSLAPGSGTLNRQDSSKRTRATVLVPAICHRPSHSMPPGQLSWIHMAVTKPKQPTSERHRCQSPKQQTPLPAAHLPLPFFSLHTIPPRQEQQQQLFFFVLSSKQIQNKSSINLHRQHPPPKGRGDSSFLPQCKQVLPPRSLWAVLATKVTKTQL